MPFPTACEELRITSYPFRSMPSIALGKSGRSSWCLRRSRYRSCSSVVRISASLRGPRASGRATLVYIGALGQRAWNSSNTCSAPPKVVSQSATRASLIVTKDTEDPEETEDSGKRRASQYRCNVGNPSAILGFARIRRVVCYDDPRCSNDRGALCRDNSDVGSVRRRARLCGVGMRRLASGIPSAGSARRVVLPR